MPEGEPFDPDTTRVEGPTRGGRDLERRAARPVVLVTGAAGGIGGALVRAFAAAGYATVGTDLGGAAPDGLAVDLWCRADVTDAEDMAAAVVAATDRFGRLDVLVANAGITALGAFDATSDATFEQVMDVNLHGAVRSARAALPALRVTGGRIVAIASVAGFAPVLGRPAYVASKHAVAGLFESLRYELAPRGIGVTVVYPTFLATAPADANVTQRGAGVPAAGTGRSTTGGLLDADDVAAAVVAAVRRGRDQVFPGRTARLAHLAHRLAPRLYAWAMVRRLRG